MNFQEALERLKQMDPEAAGVVYDAYARLAGVSAAMFIVLRGYGYQVPDIRAKVATACANCGLTEVFALLTPTAQKGATHE